MTNDKEKVVNDFYDMIIQSWTYARLSDTEKKYLYNTFFDSVPTKNSLKGTYKQRWSILQAIYDSYINALGYCDIKNGFVNWREQ